mmetsp:Transcript_81662/g.236728  ORF Transcript_81662/g.236728 Transcript_81662/m.236728 type:complete len:200 (-) Transcript_81662:31-630(-)
MFWLLGDTSGAAKTPMMRKPSKPTVWTPAAAIESMISAWRPQAVSPGAMQEERTMTKTVLAHATRRSGHNCCLGMFEHPHKSAAANKSKTSTPTEPWSVNAAATAGRGNKTVHRSRRLAADTRNSGSVVVAHQRPRKSLVLPKSQLRQDRKQPARALGRSPEREISRGVNSNSPGALTIAEASPRVYLDIATKFAVAIW